MLLYTKLDFTYNLTLGINIVLLAYTYLTLIYVLSLYLTANKCSQSSSFTDSEQEQGLTIGKNSHAPHYSVKLYYITVLCPVVYRKLGDVTDTDISNQIHAMLATPSSRPSTTTATASSRVLSSAKLTASLKSNSYMGRKITYPGNVLFGV